MHSSLSAESVTTNGNESRAVRRGSLSALGAVFAPVLNLGLIIIDEEQEDTYKSENAPRYHARDIVKFRCACNNAALLLGSATPDVVSSFLSLY